MHALRIYADPAGASWDDVKAGVSTANGLQTAFKCALQPLPVSLPSPPHEGDLDAYERQLSQANPPVSGLFFLEEWFDSSLLILEVLPRRIYVSGQVDRELTSPPFRLYVLYQIAAAALTLGAKLTPVINKEMIHRPPVGCLWDWWEKAGERATAMMIARICPSCQRALQLHGGLTPEAILAAQQMLDYVRRTMLGESPAVAHCVFIAYGHGDDWTSLRDLLEGWGLEVEHFNKEAVAGVMVAERWKRMLDRSRFAFAVMTPDDQLANGKRQARQNVIHELGLCHARMGLHNTAILLADGTEPFTNVGGVSYIPFRQGDLPAQTGTIRRLLEERGILDAGSD
jgi:hypothetical protein